MYLKTENFKIVFTNDLSLFYVSIYTLISLFPSKRCFFNMTVLIFGWTMLDQVRIHVSTFFYLFVKLLNIVVKKYKNYILEIFSMTMPMSVAVTEIVRMSKSMMSMPTMSVTSFRG